MKNILFIFVLSLYSIQGYASSCPDGSEPVKSISADGTYFVFNCGGSADSSNETSKTKSNGLVPNTLKQIKVIKDWEPITNHLALKNYVSKTSVNEHKIRWNAKYKCLDRITYAKQISNKWFHKNSMIWAHCAAYVHMAGTKNPQVVGDILLAWASVDKDPIVWSKYYGDKPALAGYQLPSTIGTFSQFYALWYNEIAYTPGERKRVDDYMTMKLMEQQFPVLKSDSKGRYRKCNINDINNPIRERTDSNNCGNIRMKVAVGEIMLGFRLENQTLLDKGHDDMYVVNAFINKDGINISHAAKGANTVNYSWEYTYYYSILAEIYRSVGYDFFEHTLPRGAKVHEYIAFNYRLLKDFTLTSQWAGAKPGMNGRSYNKIKNLSQAEFQKSDYGHNVIDWNNRDKYFVKAHKRFVRIYMPHLNTDVTYFDMIHNSHTLSANIGVDAYMLYLGNLSLEDKIYDEKIALRIAEKIAEKLEEQKANNRARLKANVEKIQAEKIAEIAKLATELSIFEIKDGVITLTLDKVDFAETEPPQKQKKNDNSELHKAEISGSLNLSSSKQIDLKTLVFQKATDKTNILSINVGDLTPPEMNPFKRHRDTLQKECGMGLMNQYDWLSFISKTSDTKNARNQQCHYDYFKGANDSEALELFQAVLGGTDSILDYLEANVE